MIEVHGRIVCDTEGCDASEDIVLRSKAGSNHLAVRKGVWDEGLTLPSEWTAIWSKSESCEYIQCPTCAKTHDARKRLEKSTA